MPNSSQRQTMANAIRALAMDAVQAANSGHPGMPMGMADAATALFCDHLKFDAASPDWPDRDRFVLSAGHGSMLIYALLHLTGYEDMTIEQIRNFRQLGARTAGHPEFGHAKGIETTTGPLGQGIANAVGMAMPNAIWPHVMAMIWLITTLMSSRVMAVLWKALAMKPLQWQVI